MKLRKNFEGNDYLDNSAFGKFLLYKLFYPVFNFIGLNRPFNLLRHRLGFYNEFVDGRCQWCGEKHRLSTPNKLTQ